MPQIKTIEFVVYDSDGSEIDVFKANGFTPEKDAMESAIALAKSLPAGHTVERHIEYYTDDEPVWP